MCLGKLVAALAFLWVGVNGAVRLYGPEAKQVVVSRNRRQSEKGGGTRETRRDHERMIRGGKRIGDSNDLLLDCMLCL